ADHVIADRRRRRHGKHGGGDAGNGTEGENATHEKSPCGDEGPENPCGKSRSLASRGAAVSRICQREPCTWFGRVPDKTHTPRLIRQDTCAKTHTLSVAHFASDAIASISISIFGSGRAC